MKITSKAEIKGDGIVARSKTIKIDKQTVDVVRTMETEYRFQELEETLDRIFEKNVFSSHFTDWTDEEIAKLDYILCEMESAIEKSKNIKIVITEY